jgi:tRNA threonylcarbamoyladenosine biosynthesis protein TsaE
MKWVLELMAMNKIKICCEEEMEKCAKFILQTLNNLDLQQNSSFSNFISLEGNLGAGKTTLVRYILRELGFSGKVKSPTYTFLESYNINFLHFSQLNHFDLYRFTSPHIWLEHGFDEYLTSHSLTFIEWAEMAKECLPLPIMKIKINVSATQNLAREIEVYIYKCKKYYLDDI